MHTAEQEVVRLLSIDGIYSLHQIRTKSRRSALIPALRRMDTFDRGRAVKELSDFGA